MFKINVSNVTIVLLCIISLGCNNSKDNLETEHQRVHNYFNKEYYNIHYKTLGQLAESESDADYIRVLKSSYTDIHVMQDTFEKAYKEFKPDLNEESKQEFQELSESIENYKETLLFRMKEKMVIDY